MRSLDGQILKQMLLSAANNLYNHYPEIDALNVFPVPDGDTGTNMNLTLTSGAKEILNRNDDDAYSIANLFSRGLLMGARGNSGVITSQIFRGFASSLKDKKIIKVTDFADAFANGSTVAYKAVMRPVEGTILTVIREASEALSDYVSKEVSIEKAMKYFVEQARESLKRTPELLPVLKEVGVVDSGGAGLVTIFEGMESALNGKFIEKNVVTSIEKKTSVATLSDTNGYCVEFVLKLGPADEKKVFIQNRFSSVLDSHGKSIRIISNDDTVKVHIHTLTPGSILTYAQSFGEFTSLKIENLAEGKHTSLIDSIEEAKNDEPLKESAIVSISAGKGMDEYFKEIGVDRIVSGGQTMNPSIEDIISNIRACHAKVVYVLPNNSNIVMAAFQAADVLADEIDVKVITTKTIPQGIVAASAFNPDASVEDNVNEMKNSYANLKSGSVTYAIKDTVIDGFEVTKDYFMGIFDKKIVVCVKNKVVSLLKLLDQMINEDSFLVTLFIGSDVTIKEEEKVREELPKKFPNVEFDIRRGDQPVYSFLIGVE